MLMIVVIPSSWLLDHKVGELLVGWIVGWLASGWLVGGWIVHWLVDWFVRWSGG